jgi:hypothetical protein
MSDFMTDIIATIPFYFGLRCYVKDYVKGIMMASTYKQSIDFKDLTEQIPRSFLSANSKRISGFICIP